MPPVGFTRLLALTISFTGAAGTYYMVKDLITKRVAYISLGILLSTFTYFYYTNMLLTGIPASFLVLTSVYLTAKERYLTAGLLGGLAFLTRFPAAVIGPAMVLFILYSYRDDLLAFVKNSALYSVGFFTLAGIYLAANWYYLGSVLEPFISGIAVPASNADVYLYGLYYFFNGVKTSPLLLALPAGIYMIVKNREEAYYPFLLAFVFLYGFFTVFPHKEVRFLLIFLPLAAVLSAYAIDKLLSSEYIEKARFDDRIGKEALFVAVAALIMIGSFGATFYDNRAVNTDAVSYYQAHSDLSGTVAANDASIMAYGDFSYHALPPAVLEGAYENAHDQADYVSINSCAWYCTESIENCRSKIEDLEQDVADRYPEVYSHNGSYCSYNIYKIE
jgi:4-amino-4-deoxy-L-arabinose transferase-like glycosyltransferase